MKNLTLKTILGSLAVSVLFTGCFDVEKTGVSEKEETITLITQHTTVPSLIEMNVEEINDMGGINVVCDSKTKGMTAVLAAAEKYNKVAQKEGLEFRRLGVNNSALINATKEAIANGETVVNPLDFKGKVSKTKLEVTAAGERACRFGVQALLLSVDGQTTWETDVPK